MIHGRTPHAVHSPKTQEYLEGWQRARAELDNYRKRVATEHLTRAQQAKRTALEPLFSVADNFQAMITHVPTELQDNGWVQGVMHVARQLDQVLTEQGVTIIDPHGQMFDPKQHEAVEQVAQAETASGTILAVIQRGYLLGDLVLRPARVKVAQ